MEGISYGEDGLFEVTTSRGHRIKCKELVLSTGLTGPRGEQAKSLKVLDQLHESAPSKSIVMQKVSDSQTHAAEFTDIARVESKSTLIVNDRLPGDQTFRQTFSAIPAGERAAMTGSGEAGIKGALEMAHLNPNITIDFYVKGRLESAQVQVPSENFRQPVIEKTLHDPERSKALAEMYDFFDTPVTPRSLQEVFELQAAGRIRLLELGRYFDENSVQLTAQDDGTTKLEFKDPQVVAQLNKNEAEYKAKGLLPKDESFTQAVTYRAFVQAPGYRKTPLSENPLAQFPESCRDRVHANSITSSSHPAQSALPGLGTGGRHLAEELAERLVPADRRVDITVPSDRGVDYRNWSDKDVNEIIVNIGGDPKLLAEVRAEIENNGSSPREYLLYLTSVDNKLRSIAEKPESERTQAEQEVLDRGLALGKRLHEAVPKYYKDLIEPKS